MAKVTVLPGGVEFEARPGEPLLVAALKAGVYWPTSCGGHATCGICAVEVLDPGPGLPEPSELEAVLVTDAVIRVDPQGVLRLGCQLTTDHDIVVYQPDVRRY